MLELRSTALGLALAPPLLPASLRALIQRDDPPYVPFRARNASNPFLGKRILVLSGMADELVPWAASQVFVEGLEVGKGRKEVIVMEGVGHAYPETMKREAFQFVWEEIMQENNIL
jgi:hypothetical protein